MNCCGQDYCTTLFLLDKRTTPSSVLVNLKMRNLLLTQRAHTGANSTEVPDLPLTATAWDPATNSLICTFGPSEVESVIEVKRLQVYSLQKLGS